MADLPNTSCNITSNFNNHQIIFDITYISRDECLMVDSVATGPVRITLPGDAQGLARIKSQTILRLSIHRTGELTV